MDQRAAVVSRPIFVYLLKFLFIFMFHMWIGGKNEVQLRKTAARAPGALWDGTAGQLWFTII